jgi:hypothetical protein
VILRDMDKLGNLALKNGSIAMESTVRYQVSKKLNHQHLEIIEIQKFQAEHPHKLQNPFNW